MVKGTGNLGGLFRALVGIGALGLLVAGWTLLHGTSVAQAQAVSNDQTALEPVTFAGCDNEQVTMKRREYEVFRAHNEHRASKGLRAFCVDATLQKVAQGHSTDMATRNFYSHTNPDGKYPGHRLTAAGYGCYPYGGENIGVYWPEETAAQVTRSWIDSSAHRANIEDTRHLRIGIGSADDADFSEWMYDDPYWGSGVNYTVNFAGNDCITGNRSVPTITRVRPAAGAKVRDATPRFSAVVRDSQTDLAKSDIRVYIDGKRFYNFAYSESQNRLGGVSRKLAAGKSHTVRIVANDGDGKSASETARFTVR